MAKNLLGPRISPRNRPDSVLKCPMFQSARSLRVAMQKFRILFIFLIALLGFAPRSGAHSLPNDQWMIVLAKLSINQLPKTLSQFCDPADEAIQARINALALLLSKKLLIDDICSEICVNTGRSQREVDEISKQKVAQMMSENKSKTYQKMKNNVQKCCNYSRELSQEIINLWPNK